MVKPRVKNLESKNTIYRFKSALCVPEAKLGVKKCSPNNVILFIQLKKGRFFFKKFIVICFIGKKPSCSLELVFCRLGIVLNRHHFCSLMLHNITRNVKHVHKV